MDSLGLALSGGGAKGAYQIGVWRAFDEFRVTEKLVGIAGTSVGALNMALMAQGDLSHAESVWENMAFEELLRGGSKSLAARIGSVARSIGAPAGMATALASQVMATGVADVGAILERHLDWEAVQQFSQQMYATAWSATRGGHYFPLHHTEEERGFRILRASAAVPVIFSSVEIDGTSWWDGFLHDNTPIRPLADSGCSIVFAIMLDCESLYEPDDFPGCTILPIYPQEGMGGLIACANFDSETIGRLMEQGYNDTVRILEVVWAVAKAEVRWHKAADLAIEQMRTFRQLMEAWNHPQNPKNLARESAQHDVHLLADSPKRSSRRRIDL